MAMRSKIYHLTTGLISTEKKRKPILHKRPLLHIQNTNTDAHLDRHKGMYGYFVHQNRQNQFEGEKQIWWTKSKKNLELSSLWRRQNLHVLGLKNPAEKLGNPAESRAFLMGRSRLDGIGTFAAIYL